MATMAKNKSCPPAIGVEKLLNDLRFLLLNANRTNGMLILNDEGKAIIKALGGGSSSGGTVLLQAGENINSHVPVVLLGNKVYKYSNDNLGHQFGFTGFTSTSVVINGFVEIQLPGTVISLSGWGLTQGSQYLAGISGAIQLTDSVSGGFRHIIGYAESTNDLMILNFKPILKL